MPRRLSRGFVGRSRVARRETLWIAAVDNGQFSTLLSNAAVFFSSLNVAALALRPFTVVRVRGLLTVKSDQIANIEQGNIAAGIAVVSDQAVAVGVTAMPTPVTESGSDLWMFHQFLTFGFVISSAVGIAAPGITQMVIDNKAMRKVAEGEDLVTLVENESTTAGCQFKLSTRVLIKLH